MKKAEQVVFVIYDDPSMRTAIRELIEAVGLTCQTFGSGQDQDTAFPISEIALRSGFPARVTLQLPSVAWRESLPDLSKGN